MFSLLKTTQFCLQVFQFSGSLFRGPRYWRKRIEKKVRKIGWGLGEKEREMEHLIPVCQLLVYPLIGEYWQLTSTLTPITWPRASWIKKIHDRKQIRRASKFTEISLDNCLQGFPNIDALRWAKAVSAQSDQKERRFCDHCPTVSASA